MPDDHDNLDLLIDSALCTYAEPRAGLESRVLKHLTARPTRRRWLPFAIALPLAACLVLLILLIPRHDRIEPVHQAQHTPAPLPEQVTAPSPAPRPHTLKPRAVFAHTTPAPAPLPKPDVFPTPQPLSPEEQALARFAAHTPVSELKTLQEAQQKKDEPLHIAEIQIPPLEPLDKTDKNGN
jgi:hypothetical protein